MVFGWQLLRGGWPGLTQFAFQWITGPTMVFPHGRVAEALRTKGGQYICGFSLTNLTKTCCV